MKVSLNTIRKFTDVSLGIDELVAMINSQLGGVEGVTDLAERYHGATIVRVVTCEDHPDADRLHVCTIDDGKSATDVERTPEGFVQVVCGAPNVRAGMFAVWLPPGSTVPASATEKEPFVLSARKLRGVISNGMLASPKELGLGDGHEGLLELDLSQRQPGSRESRPGDSFAVYCGLDDTTIEIENKMFTHRPDCFGQLGVAREIAGIQHRPFTSPEWYMTLPDFQSGEGLELSVKNEAIDVVPRFMVVALSNVTVKPSPLWLQAELVRLGSKPINNIVDVTNYVMLLTGQPTHAYDYDKLSGSTLGVRRAREKETVTLLNHKTYALTTDDLVIVDGNGPVGLAGIMGGGESEVSDATNRIVVECASFDMYAVRKTSMRHGVFTDALTRFNKGQSPLQNAPILAFLIDLIQEVSGGEVASHVFDDSQPLKDHEPVKVAASFINDRLGLALSAEDYATLLTNVEFETNVQKDHLTVTPPFWRTDIVLPEDLVEEAGRLYGFDRLPRELPNRTTKPSPVNERREAKHRMRGALSRAGGTEVLTYSFVHENLMQRAGQDSGNAFRLSNALSPDLHYYRLSILPSLLDKIRSNVKAGNDEFLLFEIGKGHSKLEPLTDEGLPPETELIEAVYTSLKPAEGAVYYRARRLMEYVADELALGPLRFVPVREAPGLDRYAAFEPSRSAYVETAAGRRLGMVGELKASVRTAFKLPSYTAGVTIDFSDLFEAAAHGGRAYRPLSRYPKVSQDISLKVDTTVEHGALQEVVTKVLGDESLTDNATATCTTIAIYEPAGSSSKTVTFHIEITSYERTLTDTDVSTILDEITRVASDELHAERA